MSVSIQGNNGYAVNADANNNLQVRPPDDAATTGYVWLADSASPTRTLEVSEDYRVRCGTDSQLFFDDVSSSSININIYTQSSSTFTLANSNGFYVLNSGSSTAAGNAILQTARAFKFNGSYPLYLAFRAKVENLPITNGVAELGIGFVSGSAAPTDGVFFRWTTSGGFSAVVNINGTETETQLSSPATSALHDFIISIQSDTATFWVDDVKVATLRGATGSEGVMRSACAPAVMRVYASATTSAAPRLFVSEVDIGQGDLNMWKPWGAQTTQSGNGAYQGATGFSSLGQTANWTNSTGPTSATLSNTTPSYATLGGLWQFASVGSAVTDYALFGYLVPANSVANSSRSLVVTGVKISGVNTGAANGATAYVLQWGLAANSSAASLATADSSTAPGPRRVGVGFQSIAGAAAIGAMLGPDIEVQLPTPLVVDPGRYLHVIVTVVAGGATGSQVIRGTCFINGYWD